MDKTKNVSFLDVRWSELKEFFVVLAFVLAAMASMILLLNFSADDYGFANFEIDDFYSSVTYLA